jgi:hypothetical protein
VREHLRHPERVGHAAGVLAARAAEGRQHVARHVVAALHGNLLDRVRHAADRDLQEAFGERLGRLAPAGTAWISSASAANFATTPSRSSGWSAFGPNTRGKCSGWILPSITLQSVTVSGPPRR